MAARYDKYDPKSGGFRAKLDAALTGENVGVPLGVGLNANGRVVVGAGNSGVRGVLVVDHPMDAGDPVDVMTSGEVVDVEDLTAGTAYSAAADGSLGTEETDTPVGFTAEATRLVVRV
ncbi:hypothetical protein [Nocardioides sp. zg-DK7169]|uniref:hypothetical protein n=1 Tax=Nocardioides sp. zg-DK7169 TaxID=2736600 RepID=UPI0015538882|nr:hypothetical protein [Nocardioides sp. zg-DK7169]NPC97889.1 hypothetical protein [Nocardioides sp. zg-DK7169]